MLTGARLLLVHAHPDDETLCNGGTIARYAEAGVHVTVVTCTLGEQGEVIPADLAGLAAAGVDQLGGYRVAELRAAGQALGVAEHRFLGGIGRWRDSGMAGTAANNHPRALAAGSLAEQAEALSAIIAELRPQVVVSYAGDGGYGHPDHVRAHDITAAATGDFADLHGVFWVVAGRSVIEDGVAALAGLAGLPFRLPVPNALPAVPDAVVTTTVDVAEQVPRKLAALRAHATQVSVWENADGQRAYALSDGVARPVCMVEQYVLARGRVDPAAVRTDLFGGWRP